MMKLTVFCLYTLVLFEELLNFVFELDVSPRNELAFLVGSFHFCF